MTKLTSCSDFFDQNKTKNQNFQTGFSRHSVFVLEVFNVVRITTEKVFT